MLGGSGGAVVRVAMPICQSSAPPAAAVSAGCSFAFAGRKPIPKFTYSVRPIHPFSGLSSSQSSQLALSLSRQMLKKIQTYYAPIYPQIATAAASSSSSTSGLSTSRLSKEHSRYIEDIVPKRPKAGSVEYVKEPATNVKFQRALNVPGCSASLSLVGTGYREKVFAIIGVKVYAAGLYVNPAILSELNSWKGWSSDEIEGDLSLFNSIYQSHREKSLQITLVRDVDGKTFWDALDEAVSPRIKAPSSTSESALSTFRSVFWGQSLKKGTLIFLTWLEPSKMLVSVLSDGVPTGVEATVESKDVTKALFDVFWGDSPVSPSLKSSVAAGLAAAL